MSNRAILVVDMQNEYFPGGKLPLSGIESASANAARIMNAARAKGDVVVNIRHEMPGGPIFTPGTEGVEINASVAPAANEAVIVKNFPTRSARRG